MGIILIVNGYFRSGTTAMWKMIKQCNKDKKVFYEPFHTKLFQKIENEFGLNKSHGIELWDEYRDMGNDFIQSLKSKYKFGKYGFSNDINDYIEYLEKFDEIESDIILQPNRLSFFLGEMVEYFNIQAIQLVRNPFNVYKSVIKNLRSNIFRSVLSPIVKGYRLGSAYYSTIYICDYINKNHGKIDKYIFKRRFINPWKMFIISWVNSNYYALRNPRVIALPYEWLISEPYKVRNVLSDINIKIDLNFFHRINNYTNIDWVSNKELFNLSEKLNLIEKYRHIIGRLNLNKSN
jgi:hypothetical protein